MVSFLSSWVTPVTPGDTSTIANTSQQAVCFHRQLDNWMPGSLTCLRAGPEPKTCGSVHCGSVLLKQVEH